MLKILSWQRWVTSVLCEIPDHNVLDVNVPDNAMVGELLLLEPLCFLLQLQFCQQKQTISRIDNLDKGISGLTVIVYKCTEMYLSLCQVIAITGKSGKV